MEAYLGGATSVMQKTTGGLKKSEIQKLMNGPLLGWYFPEYPKLPLTELQAAAKGQRVKTAYDQEDYQLLKEATKERKNSKYAENYLDSMSSASITVLLDAVLYYSDNRFLPMPLPTKYYAFVDAVYLASKNDRNNFSMTSPNPPGFDESLVRNNWLHYSAMMKRGALNEISNINVNFDDTHVTNLVLKLKMASMRLLNARIRSDLGLLETNFAEHSKGIRRNEIGSAKTGLAQTIVQLGSGLTSDAGQLAICGDAILRLAQLAFCFVPASPYYSDEELTRDYGLEEGLHLYRAYKQKCEELAVQKRNAYAVMGLTTEARPYLARKPKDSDLRKHEGMQLFKRYRLNGPLDELTRNCARPEPAQGALPQHTPPPAQPNYAMAEQCYISPAQTPMKGAFGTPETAILAEEEMTED